MMDAYEKIERAALADLHAAAGQELRRELGLATYEVGGAFVSIAAALPPTAVVINRAIGLGLERPATREDVEEIAATYHRAGVSRYFVHIHPDAEPETLCDWCAAVGWQKDRGWYKFVRGTEPPPQIKTDLTIREIGPEHGAAFGRIVCETFEIGRQATRWLAQLPGRPGWHIFMSFVGEQPAGAGALFVQDGIGWLDMGGTVPAFRTHGSHSAIIARRIEAAIELGCRELCVTTGEAVPGDAQRSYKNLVNAGFSERFLRPNWGPPRA